MLKSRYTYNPIGQARDRIKKREKERKSVYENKYTVTNYNASEGYTEPLNDIEI